MWIPPENTDPKVFLAPTRKSIAVLGAVFPKDGRFAYMPAPIFNAETFLKFLKRLMKRRRNNRKLVVILDNARWHHARLLRPWLYQNRKKIELFFLPPYSPHLNPIERVWKLVRYDCTHNQYFKTLAEVRELVEAKFSNWTKPNSTLRKLCASN